MNYIIIIINTFLVSVTLRKKIKKKLRGKTNYYNI